MFRFAIIAAAVAVANAACDNACNGHGTCGAEDVCNCYPNYRLNGEVDGDCSDRVCPFDVAWVDHISLNTDKALSTDRKGTTSANDKGAVHNYAECSGRGLCDRESGTCSCFDGYSGKACQRTTCPNDCNGHGTCEYIAELPYGTVFGDYVDGAAIDTNNPLVGAKPFNFSSDIDSRFFDAYKTRQCKCDAGYGGADCSLRKCPFGNDILDVDGSSNNQIQAISLHAYAEATPAATTDAVAAYTNSALAADDAKRAAMRDFALAFTAKTGERFVTKPIRFGADTTETAILNALMELPNHVIGRTENTVDPITVTYTHAAGDMTSGGGVATDMYDITIEFKGSNVQGTQHLLEVLTEECGEQFEYPGAQAGCAQQMYGTTIPQFATDDGATNAVYSHVKQSQAADLQSYECGRRGKCDYDTGICQCFSGYKGAHCEDLTALV
eukprot:CAMPEP_0118862324 /NCGR_PEP_ID=MMETSP1163-20130328/7562_1 /TAXON_ID=124430 /ORGANISM="Phaeomonas parva, Strain CCMP2877" /LENGTH=440 /DNA_ID=CAMNT_0006796215 /DNA_START=25 /DNA_END=1347 /DNA_ORIENTATION=+